MADLLLVTVHLLKESKTPENVCVSHLRRVNAEVLKRIKSDEDVSNISVNLQLIISPLEVADYCLLRERRETCYKQHQQSIHCRDKHGETHLVQELQVY